MDAAVGFYNEVKSYFSLDPGLNFFRGRITPVREVNSAYVIYLR